MMLVNRADAARAGVLLILAILLPLTVFSAPKTYRIDLPTRTLTPADDGGQWLAQRTDSGASTIVLQFRDHPADNVKRGLSQAGVQLQEYIGGGAWVAYLQPGVESSVFDNLDLRWAGPMLPEDKVNHRVAANDMPSWAVTPDGNLYAVVMMKNVPESEAEALIYEAGGEPGALISVLNT
ncbi:hypothetical protein KQI52_03875 [bacterium]|nr:hypothetical protein [bacterium]